VRAFPIATACAPISCYDALLRLRQVCQSRKQLVDRSVPRLYEARREFNVIVTSEQCKWETRYTAVTVTAIIHQQAGTTQHAVSLSIPTRVPAVRDHRSSHSDVMFADDREYGQEIGNAKKMPNPFAKVDKF
jgi:hypothetical protein